MIQIIEEISANSNNKKDDKGYCPYRLLPVKLPDLFSKFQPLPQAAKKAGFFRNFNFRGTTDWR